MDRNFAFHLFRYLWVFPWRMTELYSMLVVVPRIVRSCWRTLACDDVRVDDAAEDASTSS
jgi:hypothetical protein